MFFYQEAIPALALYLHLLGYNHRQDFRREGDVMDSVMFLPQNSEREIQLRRYRDALAISGGAVIAFGLWDVIKLFIGLFLGQDTVKELIAEGMKNSDIPEDEMGMARLLVWVIVMMVLLVISAVTILYHIYIGLNALRVGRQTAKKKKNAYLVLTALSIVFSAIILILSITSLVSGSDTENNIGYATILLELTSLMNYSYLFYAALKIRKLERETL